MNFEELILYLFWNCAVKFTSAFFEVCISFRVLGAIQGHTVKWRVLQGIFFIEAVGECYGGRAALPFVKFFRDTKSCAWIYRFTLKKKRTGSFETSRTPDTMTAPKDSTTFICLHQTDVIFSRLTREGSLIVAQTSKSNENNPQIRHELAVSFCPHQVMTSCVFFTTSVSRCSCHFLVVSVSILSIFVSLHASCYLSRDFGSHLHGFLQNCMAEVERGSILTPLTSAFLTV